MHSLDLMESRKKVILTALVLLAAGMALGAGATSESPGVGGSPEGTLVIATGVDPNVDGYLSVAPDDFGAWASLGFGGGGDIFNPAGALGPLEPTFSSALFLFAPSRSERVIVTDNASHVGVAFDGSVTLAVTSMLVGSDTNGDTVDDTLVSSFSATGTASDTALDVDVTQMVASEGPGVATLWQDYDITNNGPTSIDLVLARVYDGDLIWDGDFANDLVGTGFNALGGDRFVFQQEPGDANATITMSSPSATSYWGGKQFFQPALGPPPYDFGTDTEVFDNFGVPASWVNNIANVGYDTDGVSNTGPPEADAHTGLGFSLTLGPGESATVSIHHTYGQEFPTPPPAPQVPTIEIPTLGSAGLVFLAVLVALIAGLLIRRRSEV